jgi:hypothetical protein
MLRVVRGKIMAAAWAIAALGACGGSSTPPVESAEVKACASHAATFCRRYFECFPIYAEACTSSPTPT